MWYHVVMKKYLSLTLLLIVFVALTSCAGPPAGLDTPTPRLAPADAATSTPAPAHTPTAAPTPVVTPDATAATPDASITLTVLYTNDEHGWMAGREKGQGAANLMGLWQEKFGYDRDDSHFLLLSGGDNWTGPAISSWFKGESMIEVMNAMGYDASAVGNHEFDFGLDVLKARAEQAHFPYLAANLSYKRDGQVPTDLGVLPYTIIDAGEVQVGVIGLANTGTPHVTNPAHVGELQFAPYVETLQQVVPQVRAAGADVIIVVSHLCNEELRYTAAQTQDLGIALFGGGHCHQKLSEKSGDAILLTSGSYLQNFGWATLQVDADTGQIIASDFGVEPNRGGQEDREIAGIIARWQEEADAALGQSIGYLAEGLPRRSKAMQKLITETWLLGYPNADVAITNLGGMREAMPAGPITIGDIISVMPFDNVLVDVKLTGEQLREVISQQEGRAAVGGMHRQGLGWILNRTGEPLQDDAIYHVLVNDFMYAGGDDYDLLAEADPEAYNTSIDWRQPVIEWIEAQNSTPEQPLDEAIRALGD